jgi:tRNA U34 2-thiouridine synthase MnmA/TrmU
MIKAIALISGGLDSLLAAKVVQQQAIEVIGVYFKIPFSLREKSERRDFALELSRISGIDLKTVVLGEEFLEIVKYPKHGRGANINPCIDCKILMLKKAKEMMQDLGASFLITGEVLGQRPMSQHNRALDLIEQEAGVKGFLLRPLSAKLLEPSIPEQKGWVDRNKLFDFSGRSRKAQIDLAVMLGLIDYQQPAGGCLLTDPRFSQRLRDLMKHGGYDLKNVGLLKFGRHFRLSEMAKLIVGRDEAENIEIERLAIDGDYLFYPPGDIAGPTSLGRGEFSDVLIELSARITCRYCDRKQDPTDIVYRRFPDKEERIISVAAASEEELARLRI